MATDGAADCHIAPGASPNARGLPTPEPDSAALDLALRQGDHRRAIALIDEIHGAALFRFIWTIVRRDDLADDLYQITLLQAFRDLGRFAGRSTVRTWLFGIASHRCLDTLKRARRHRARFTSADELPEIADAAPGADQRLTDVALVTALETCLAEVAPEVRMVLMMRFAEGFAYDDIARICRASPEAIRARVSRSLPALRRCVELRGVL